MSNSAYFGKHCDASMHRPFVVGDRQKNIISQSLDIEEDEEIKQAILGNQVISNPVPLGFESGVTVAQK